MDQEVYPCTLQRTDTSHLEIGLLPQKGRVHLPTIQFSGAFAVSSLEGHWLWFPETLYFEETETLMYCNRNKENNFLWCVVSNLSDPLLQLRITSRTAQISMSWKHHLREVLGKMLGSFWITCHCECYPKMARIFSLLYFRNMAWGSPHVRKLQFVPIQFQAQPSANKTTTQSIHFTTQCVSMDHFALARCAAGRLK